MDQLVLDALAKWPNVPACTGWLRLDRRGQWRMRDDACQAAGLPGDPIRHQALNAFIARNYEADDQGRWFFQNGPQRVYVDLAYTPYVVRWHQDAHAFVPPTPGANETTSCPADGSVHGASVTILIDQCGNRFVPHACWSDDEGQVLFSGEDAQGHATVALLHDHDLLLFADQVNWRDDGTAASLRDLYWPSRAAASSGAQETASAGHGDDVALAIKTIRAADVPAHFGFVQRPTLAESPVPR